MNDPNRWQPLSIDGQMTQNGQRVGTVAQRFIGPNWGFVTPFAITADDQRGLPFDPGPPPLLGVDDLSYIDGATRVVELSSRLDPLSDSLIDISPASLGDVELGTYDAAGRATNSATGESYEPHLVPEADYGRVIAEYWADGPDSETPPGHWNTLAIEVGNELERTGELTIDGDPVDRLEWDVKIGLALNGALHDTAIAVWGAKAHYDYARPISMIRHLGQRGQLNEQLGIIETITEITSAPGERHAHLSAHIGEQAVYGWRGEPSDPATITSGVGWIRAAEWVPYQRASFVSPAFAAYVSGHSGFSRAAAEVLTELTGSPYFPGGLATHTVEPGGLLHEAGPTQTVTLQWATYRDAADQAGISASTEEFTYLPMTSADAPWAPRSGSSPSTTHAATSDLDLSTSSLGSSTTRRWRTRRQLVRTTTRRHRVHLQWRDEPKSQRVEQQSLRSVNNPICECSWWPPLPLLRCIGCCDGHLRSGRKQATVGKLTTSTGSSVWQPDRPLLSCSRRRSQSVRSERCVADEHRFMSHFGERSESGRRSGPRPTPSSA
ncbi:MAG: vanadium-dependent haloperoxidase [Acidimicrobiia bacterium]|nr:vanadium-dependent haloperoxidase [Acidimicrobiia bacterium]